MVNIFFFICQQVTKAHVIKGSAFICHYLLTSCMQASYWLWQCHWWFHFEASLWFRAYSVCDHFFSSVVNSTEWLDLCNIERRIGKKIRIKVYYNIRKLVYNLLPLLVQRFFIVHITMFYCSPSLLLVLNFLHPCQSCYFDGFSVLTWVSIDMSNPEHFLFLAWYLFVQ